MPTPSAGPIEIIVLIVLPAAGPAPAAIKEAVWIGGSGPWTNPANWLVDGTLNEVPDNTSVDSYDVSIPPNRTVQMDSTDIVIDTLQIGFASSVVIDGGETLGLKGRVGADCPGLCNGGALEIRGGDLEIHGRIEYTGSGAVRASSTGASRIVRLGGASGTRLVVLPGETLNLTSADGGRGFLQVDSFLTNAGLIEQQNIDIELRQPVVSSGNWNVSGNSRLEIGARFDNRNAQLNLAAGGEMVFEAGTAGSPEIEGGALDIVDGGTVFVLSNTLLDGPSFSGPTGTWDLQANLSLTTGTEFQAAQVIVRDQGTIDSAGPPGSGQWVVTGNAALEIDGSVDLPISIFVEGAARLEAVATGQRVQQLELSGEIFGNGELVIADGLEATLSGVISIADLLIVDGGALGVRGGQLRNVVAELGDANSSVTLGLPGGAAFVESTILDNSLGGSLVGDNAWFMTGTSVSSPELTDVALRGVLQLTGTLNFCGSIIIEAGARLVMEQAEVKPRCERTGFLGDGVLEGDGDISVLGGNSLLVPEGERLRIALGTSFWTADSISEILIEGVLEGSVEDQLRLSTSVVLCGAIDLFSSDGEAVINTNPIGGFSLRACDERRGPLASPPTVRISGGATLLLQNAVAEGIAFEGSVECEECTLAGVTNRGTLGVRFPVSSLPDAMRIDGGTLRNEGTILLPSSWGSVNGSERVVISESTVIEGGGTIITTDNPFVTPRVLAAEAVRTTPLLTNLDNQVFGDLLAGEFGAPVDVRNDGRLGGIAVVGALDNVGEIHGRVIADTVSNSGLIESETSGSGDSVVTGRQGVVSSGILRAAEVTTNAGWDLVLTGRYTTWANDFGYSRIQADLDMSDGRLDPHGDGVGVLLVDGGYQQSGGRLFIDLAESETDYLNVATAFGSASFGGAVWIRSVPGFQPQPGDSFTFLGFGSSRFGTEFDAAVNATPYPIAFVLSYDDSARTVTAHVVAADPGPDLALTVTPSRELVGEGQEVRFALEVEHLGGPTATLVDVTHRLPEDFSYVSASSSVGGCSHEAGLVTCPLGALMQGESETVTVTTIAEPGPVSERIHSVAVSTADPDPLPWNNEAEVTIVVRNEVFADGFESGDVSAWNQSVP